MRQWHHRRCRTGRPHYHLEPPIGFEPRGALLLRSPATSVDICKIDVRNCDTPVSKDEIALPWEPELARESRVCQSVANNIRLACRDFL